VNVGDRVEFELVDPKRNARRGYRLEVAIDPQLPLFAGEPPAFLLVRAWGRLEGPWRVVRRRFVRLEELAAEWDRVLAVRRRHGYVAIRDPMKETAP
jgi:predicted DNA-binding WGR domain protein